MPVEAEDLGIGERAQRDGDGDGLDLFRERLEFGLLLFDLAAHLAELLRHFEQIGDLVRALQDGEVLSFFGAQVAQARLHVDVLAGDVLCVGLFAFDTGGQFADLRFGVFEVRSRDTDGDVGGGRFFCSTDLRSFEVASHALCHPADLFGSVSGTVHGQFERTGAHDLAISGGSRGFGCARGSGLDRSGHRSCTG